MTSGKVSAKGLDLVWVLEDFKKILGAKDNEPVRSPVYRLDDSRQCYLFLEPQSSDESCKDFVSVYIIACPGFVFNDAVVSVYVLNSANEEVNQKGFNQHTYGPLHGYAFTQFIKRIRFFEEASLLKDGDLYLGCKLYIDSSIIVGFEGMITLRDSFLVEENNKFEELLENHKFSDVTLLVEGKEIPVHKNIMASGSPVFAAMFSHPTRENEQNLVEIPDITYDVMQELIRFIYAARVKNLEMVADGLLIAAEKYSIKNLKMICENYLSGKLNIENIMQCTDLADMHNASFLKDKCVKFIDHSLKKVVESPLFKEWEPSIDIMKKVLCSVVRSQELKNLDTSHI